MYRKEIYEKYTEKEYLGNLKKEIYKKYIGNIKKRNIYEIYG